MKKILVFILCALLIFAMPIAASAEEVTEEVVTEESEETRYDVIYTLSGDILGLIRQYYKEIVLAIVAGVYTVWEKRRDKRLSKSMGTLNNNAVTIAKSSTEFMGNALTEMQNASGAVIKFDEQIKALLEAFKTTAEDKAMLERELVEIKNYLKVESESNIEFANELAELLSLANIPNYKKEELGSRHVAKVNAIKEAAAKAEIEAENAAKMLLPATTEEVKEDVGEET